MDVAESYQLCWVPYCTLAVIVVVVAVLFSAAMQFPTPAKYSLILRVLFAQMIACWAERESERTFEKPQGVKQISP